MSKLLLDYIYDHEANRAGEVYMTQPIGNNQVIDYTWTQTVDQARRMAAHLQSLGFEPGARIGILSKNCAHFFMAEMAIWMAGYTTVAIFPTEGPDTVNYVLTHSEASLLFVGKLDSWDKQEKGVPAGMPRIAFPLAPKTAYDTWDAITGRTQPMGGKPARADKDLAMLIYTSGSTGQPKGVMHSFERITVVGEGFAKRMAQSLAAGVERRMLSYLPLAHVFERACVEIHSMVVVCLSAPVVAEVSARCVGQDAAGQTQSPVVDSDPQGHCGQESAHHTRPGPGETGGQRLGAPATFADPVVPQTRLEPCRRLRHDRRLRLFPHHV
jgi:long-chain acyl-CoA synthetase